MVKDPYNFEFLAVAQDVHFARLEAASRTWVDNNGTDDIMSLYDECLATVRS